MTESPETIRIAGIVRESIVDGPGIRFVVFAQGCPHRCAGCHNTQTLDFSGGYDCGIDKIIAEVIKNPLLSGVTFSGGEPFCQPEAFYELAVKLKERALNLLAFTGYTYEELLDMQKSNRSIGALLDKLDYLIDGPFVLAERDLTLAFRGSKNQRLIDMNDTRNQGKLVVIEGPEK